MNLTDVLRRLHAFGVEEDKPHPESRRILHFLGKILERETVLVGIAAVVYRPGVGLLLGMRLGDHGPGHLAFPGGHLKEFEDWLTAAKREVKEETGLNVQAHAWEANQPALFVTNSLYGERHYVTVWIACRSDHGEPQNIEPDRCEGWRFYSIEELEGLVDLNVPLEAAWVPLPLLRSCRDRMGI